MFIRADQSTGAHIARESVEYVFEAIGCLHEERALKSPRGILPMQKTFGPAKGDSAEPLKKHTQICMS